MIFVTMIEGGMMEINNKFKIRKLIVAIQM